MKKFLLTFLRLSISCLTILLNLKLPIVVSALDESPDSSVPTVPSDFTDPDELPEELYDFDSDLIIRAVNPGYTEETDNGKSSNAGEFIELLNLTGAPLALAGYSIVYTGSGSPATVFTFPEESYLTGKHLLLRYINSPESSLADLTYKVGTSGLIQSQGVLELFYDDALVDSVCWNAKGDDGCVKNFSSTNKVTLVRNLSSGEFEPTSTSYTPAYDKNITDNLILPADDEPEPDEPDLAAPQCRGLEITELLTYYTNDQSEQFIEFFNPTNAPIDLDGCKLSFKNKTYDLSGTVATGSYYAYYPKSQFSLTKNPTNPLAIALIDADGSVVDEIAYAKGQKKSTSYSKIFVSDGSESWQITYAITPGLENIYQKFRSCEEGKIINEATGNCVKTTPVSSSTTLAACPEGQYRNPLTNRCKKISTTSSTLKECAEGYERNPETNRCRKITSTSGNDGADYALTPVEHSDQTVFIGIGIVGAIISLAGVYIILQFRYEIARACRKIRQRLNHLGKDLLTRASSRHRNQKT